MFVPLLICIDSSIAKISKKDFSQVNLENTWMVNWKNMGIFGKS